MNIIVRLKAKFFSDRRPDWEKAREREFILAANSLKTLSVTDRGGLSIDPEELCEQIIASREQLKHLVHKPGAPNELFSHVPGQGTSPIAETPEGVLDCREVVIWRRLTSGAAVRYASLQCEGTGRFVVAAASLFFEGAESLPRWIDSDTHRQVAHALQNGELHWYETVTQAMDAWDAEL